MTGRERVSAAISRKPADRTPKGETWIDGILANKLLNADYPLDYQHYERDLRVRRLLNMDLVNAGDWPQTAIGEDENGNTLYLSAYGYEFISGATKHVVKPPLEDIGDAKDYLKPDIKSVNPETVGRFAAETDLFVFGQIGGPVSMLDEMFPMEDYLAYCITDTDKIGLITEKVMEYEVEKAKLFIDNGADGIFFADDIAFNNGTLLPPYLMETLVFPFYYRAVAEIKKYKDLPVFFHSDGNINSVIPKIIDCGFCGLQSIQPSAGMDIGRVKELYGDALCLWGNIDLDYVMTFAAPDEVERVVKETIRVAGAGGGYILSTCNSMVGSIPPENALAMARAAE